MRTFWSGYDPNSSDILITFPMTLPLVLNRMFFHVSSLWKYTEKNHSSFIQACGNWQRTMKSTHCVRVWPTLFLSANISCLKCPLLTGICLVTCKPYINFHDSHCIFLVFVWYFVSFHFLCCTAFIYARLMRLLIKLSLMSINKWWIVLFSTVFNCHKPRVNTPITYLKKSDAQSSGINEWNWMELER